ncbi:hypothetical protein CVT25_010732 [Psilocybe cyanescens]|uniref:Fe2OG dioxygenase domain-containing protein n=1 Tax=Psilocybe cyanescens TaxID=93625 RepID=A0A409WJR7_PSICY|nr:hypothetical protein CVT25_010732 [Psilocybe cyanescens]
MSLVDTAEIIDLDFQNVPIIDLTDIRSNDAEKRRKLVDNIRDACMQVGFFYVKNHGILDSVTEGALEMAKNFFNLPMEIKMEIENRKTPNFKGYSPLLSGNNDPDGAGDLQEGFEFGWEAPPNTNESMDSGANGVMDGANVWPSEVRVPGFHTKVLQYYHAAVNLGKLMFPLFAMALNLPETFFDDKTQHSAALMKLLHYPPQIGPVDDRIIGIGAHTDWECFTILWQEPGIQALQVLNSEKKWINAPPIPGTLVINLGDQFARWTNDIFKSTVHRAINRSSVRRYSIPLFFGTDYNVKLEPMPSCVSPDRPPKYEVITAGEYVKARLQATPTPIDDKPYTINMDFQDVPIIDLNGMISNDPTERRKLADDIRNACVRVGFFYVKNHGIPDSVTEGAFEMAKKNLDFLRKQRWNAGDLHQGFLLVGQDLPDIKLTNSEAQFDTDSGYNGAMPGTNISPDAASILGLRETIM